jgi:hypothetical protein
MFLLGDAFFNDPLIDAARERLRKGWAKATPSRLFRQLAARERLQGGSDDAY